MSKIYDRLKMVDDNSYIHYYAASLNGENVAQGIQDILATTKDDILQESLNVYNKKIQGMNQKIGTKNSISNQELGELCYLVSEDFENRLIRTTDECIQSEFSKSTGQIQSSINKMISLDEGERQLGAQAKEMENIFNNYSNILKQNHQIEKAVVRRLEELILGGTQVSEDGSVSLEELVAKVSNSNSKRLQGLATDILHGRNATTFQINDSSIAQSDKGGVTALVKSLVLACSVSRMGDKSFSKGLGEVMKKGYGTHSSGLPREGDSLSEVMLNAMKTRLSNIVGIGGEVAAQVGFQKAFAEMQKQQKETENKIDEIERDINLQALQAGTEKRSFQTIITADTKSVDSGKERAFKNKEFEKLYKQMTQGPGHKGLGAQKSDVTLKISKDKVSIGVEVGTTVKARVGNPKLGSASRGISLQSGSTLASLLFRDSIMSGLDALSIITILNVREGGKMVAGQTAPQEEEYSAADASSDWRKIKEQLPYRAFLAALAENPEADNAFSVFMVYQERVYSVGRILLSLKQNSDKNNVTLRNVTKGQNNLQSGGFRRANYYQKNKFIESNDKIAAAQKRSQKALSNTLELLNNTKIRISLNSSVLKNIIQ